MTLNSAKNTEDARIGERFPVTEDPNCQRQEAIAAHVGVEAGTGCHRVGQTADAAQETGDQHASVAHLIDIDAHRVRCLGMLATGAQAQAKAGLVHDDIGHDKQDDGDGGSQVEIPLKIRLFQKLGPSTGARPKVSRVMRTQLGMAMVVRPWPWMAQVATTAKAGRNWFSAVPPMVWSLSG